jgi:hypothetical protein
MDAAHACRYALGQKNAHGGEEGSPDGLVVTCLVPRERWVLLQPVVVHALHKEGALNLKGQDGSSIRHMGCDFYPGVCLPCDELAQKSCLDGNMEGVVTTVMMRPRVITPSAIYVHLRKFSDATCMDLAKS